MIVGYTFVVRVMPQAEASIGFRALMNNRPSRPIAVPRFCTRLARTSVT
jgi:hypothetical protein